MKIKFLVLLFAFSSFFFSFAQNKSETDNVVESFSDIEIAPLIPKYQEQDWSLEKKKKFTEAYILNQIQNNLDGLGLSGITRIPIRFEIDTNGATKGIFVGTDVRILKERIIENIQSLPKFVPGMKNGKPVNVVFQSPIILKYL